jgi:LysM domain
MGNLDGGVSASRNDNHPLHQNTQNSAPVLRAKSPDAPSPKGPHDPDVPTVKDAKPAVPQNTKEHHVEEGDTLQSIADEHHTTVQKLYDLNPHLNPANQKVPPGQERDHWNKEYLEDVAKVYIPDASGTTIANAQASISPLLTAGLAYGAQILAAFAQKLPDAKEAAISDAAKEVNAMPPERRADEIESRVQDIERNYGRDAAVEFVARVVASDPDGFAEGVTMRGARDDNNSYDENTKEILADGVSRAYEKTPMSPYTSPAQFAGSLIDGMSKGMPFLGDSTLLADIVGRSGNDNLQTDFVRSGLYQAALNNYESKDKAPIQSGPTAYLVSSLAPATRNSSSAAQAVIEFAEQNDVPFTDNPGTKGPGSLATILDLFSRTETDIGNGKTENGFVTFMRAAVPSDLNVSGVPVPIAQTPLGDQQSFTLFLAVSGRESLIEANGAGGKKDPAGTALTAKLFENYYDRWIDPAGLNITVSGSILNDGVAGRSGGLYKGVDIQDAFRSFFKEAMVDSNENGPYRAELTSFVLDRVFQGYSPNSKLSDILGGQANAAANSADLLVLMGLSEQDLIKDLAAASAENKQIISFLVGAGFAVGGSFAGGAPGALVSSKAGQALVGYAIGKAQGSIQEGLVDYLASQGVSKEEIKAIQGYLGNPAAVGEALQEKLGGKAIPPAVVDAFVTAFESNLADLGAAGALQAALAVLDQDFDPPLTPEQKAAVEVALRELGQAIDHTK